MMNNEKEFEEQELPKREPLEPTSVEKKKKPKVEIEESDKIPKGHVGVVKLDEDGNEIPGSAFTITERGFHQTYEKRGFVIKKKAK